MLSTFFFYSGVITAFTGMNINSDFCSVPDVADTNAEHAISMLCYVSMTLASTYPMTKRREHDLCFP